MAYKTLAHADKQRRRISTFIASEYNNRLAFLATKFVRLLEIFRDKSVGNKTLEH